MVRANKKPKEGKTMKKIALVFLICVMQPAFATEMCARNNMIVVPLDSNVGGSGYSQNQAEMVWSATFPYGVISGEATCLSAAEGGKPSGSMGSYTNSDGNMLPQDEALAGRTGQDPDGNDRGYCWCKMTHPACSRWVFAARLPLRIVRPIVLTTAVASPSLTPLCGPGCSGRSANDVPGMGPMAKTQFLLWVA